MLAGPTFLAGGGTRGGGGEGGRGGLPPHLDSPLHSILKHKFPTQGIRYALRSTQRSLNKLAIHASGKYIIENYPDYFAIFNYQFLPPQPSALFDQLEHNI